MSTVGRILVLVAFAASGAGPARADEGATPPPRVPLVDPGADEPAERGLLHWRTFEGAQRGEGPASRIHVDASTGALQLSGDATTHVWLGVSQRVEVRAGATYRLSFEARGTGLRLDAGQFDNAYVGVAIYANRPEVKGLRHVDVMGEAWVPGEIVFRAEGPRINVVAFLSKTGRLEFRKPVLEELRPSDAFDVLVRHMARYYAHFDPAVADWGALVADHAKAFPKDGESAAFVRAAGALLAPLEDPHVWIRSPPDAAPIVPFSRAPKPNGDVKVVAAALANRRQIGRIALVGDVGADVGCLVLGSLEGTDAEFASIDAALDAWRDAGRAVLIDLRFNGGGNELRALPIAARFADRERIYALRRVRAGVAPLELSAPIEARLVPAVNARPSTPVVVLIGPMCVSSGEGMVQMFHALPHVKLVGRPTRGASGSPAPVELPNGVDVWFSRWMNFLPDGTPLERRGVPPDVVVDPDGPGDPTFEKGLSLLRELARPK